MKADMHHIIHTSLLFTCVFLLAPALPAQTANYFPLETGNTWLYKAAARGGVQYQTVRVTGTEKLGDRQYFDVSYFGRDVLLREDGLTGDVFVYDRVAGAESPWVRLSLPVDGTFASALDQCSTRGQIVARDAAESVDAGDFTNDIQVKFQGSCADAGVTTQSYAPNVGLIRQKQESFAGPVDYRLVYYRVGSQTASAAEVSFTVALDAPSYFTATTLGARLTLRNSAPDAIRLHFPSSQSFDLKILNDKGQTVYTWSADKLFAMQIRDEKLGPGELTYGATVPLDGLAAGHYVLQAYLTTDPIAWSGQVTFDIVARAGKQALRKRD
jgi:hypothetical protein